MVSHHYTCHPLMHSHVEWTVLAFTLQPQSIIAFWLVFIFRTVEGRRLSWPGLLVMLMDTHTSTNMAQCTATLLMPPTSIPLCQTAASGKMMCLKCRVGLRETAGCELQVAALSKPSWDHPYIQHGVTWHQYTSCLTAVLDICTLVGARGRETRTEGRP